MPALPRTIDLPDPAATDALGAALAALAQPGDTLLLSGPIGAGKTSLARAFIQARLGREEDVPSPTFTLVQTYDSPDGAIWHCDLYRITDPQEVWELGLDTALSRDICLIEWPDALAELTPTDALHLTFAPDPGGTRVTLAGGPGWAGRLAPLLAAA